MVRWSSWLLGLLKTKRWAIRSLRRSLRREGRWQCSLAAARLLDSGDCVSPSPAEARVGPGNSGAVLPSQHCSFTVCSPSLTPRHTLAKGLQRLSAAHEPEDRCCLRSHKRGLWLVGWGVCSPMSGLAAS